jgi:serine/threonine-protein kinase RsbT
VGVLRQQVLPIRTGADVVQFRQAVRKWASELRFSLVEQTKLVTAASELARNTLEHGGGGEGLLEVLEEGPRQAIRLTFEDEGPGIPDIQLAMKDGYTTGRGLGLGLGGAKRLVNEFSIQSAPGQGTRVAVLRWK